MSTCSAWPAIGTTAQVFVADPSVLSDARAAVEIEIDAIDRACSRFREDSELSELNRAAGSACEVSELMLEAVAVGVRAAVLTDGAVDPTVGDALVLAGYDRDFAAIDVRAGPDRPPVRAVRVPGWRAIQIDHVRRRVRLRPGVRLDLGATAKALAADRAAGAASRAAGGAAVLVSLGGDIAVAGESPAPGWPVRVTDDHGSSRDSPGQSVVIRSGGLATSSVTVRSWGPGRHHIIDPATGRPSDGRWRTASVAAGSCVDANIASTAAIVLDRRALAWLGERRLPARLVEHDGFVRAVAGWPAQEGAG